MRHSSTFSSVWLALIPPEFRWAAYERPHVILFQATIFAGNSLSQLAARGLAVR